MLDPSHLYQTATIEDKRYLVETIFNGELMYSKDGYRTTNINSVAAITYLKNKELRAKKMGQKSRLKTLPHKGSFMIQISSRFVADLKRLADLKRKMDEMGGLGNRLKR